MMVRLILPFFLVGLHAAQAQEPLFLRIRPPDGTPLALGEAGAPSADETAQRARSARESVWERSDRRARIAIASVCSGCLPPAAVAQTSPVSDRAETNTIPGAQPTAASALSIAQSGTP